MKDEYDFSKGKRGAVRNVPRYPSLNSCRLSRSPEDARLWCVEHECYATEAKCPGTNPDTINATLVTLRMQYVGACSLLGRLSSNPNISPDDRECIHQAMEDCAKVNHRVEVVGIGLGWSLEPTR